MAITEMLDITREYYRLPVTLRAAGVPIDPTALPVSFAVMQEGSKPASGDWKTGGWETGDGGAYWATILVGDSGADFPIQAGNMYDVYFRLTDTPEQPVRMVGQIQGV